MFEVPAEAELVLRLVAHDGTILRSTTLPTTGAFWQAAGELDGLATVTNAEAIQFPLTGTDPVDAVDHGELLIPAGDGEATFRLEVHPWTLDKFDEVTIDVGGLRLPLLAVTV